MVCNLCADWLDPSVSAYPSYGVGPHDCYWRKGPQFQIGQSTLRPVQPSDCFVPDLNDDETWANYQYPSACGIFYCPNCQAEKYAAAWKKLIDRIGEPPPDIFKAR